MADRHLVKQLFENTDLYLTYDYNLRIRTETVQSFTAGIPLGAVLDCPSGTGAISSPLLDRAEKLTLVDISSNMLAIAEKNTPVKQAGKVTLINKDIFETDLPSESYDLVICMGLLAHIDSPERLLKKLISLIKPGGLLILQNTDSRHFYSYLIRVYLGLKNLVSRQPYALNKVPARFIESLARQSGLQLLRTYRYNQSFLGLSNLFSNERKYKLTRGMFGTADQPRNQALGSDYTYLFKKPAN
jgi:2-polyprenyl-3-methyl-5-hydroxy-6-metoxy-1,4-benzoquinol methylase